MLVKIGVASIIIRNDKKVLLGRRIGSHGAGTWAPPGGHLEFKEDPASCAIRETKEEAGVKIMNVSPGPWTNDIFEAENKHYITLFIISKYQSGEARVLEPKKCEEWSWFNWTDFPEPLFKPLQSLIESGYSLDKLLAHIT
jgi:8-oxo-dGTP diphosphatase